MNEPEDKTKQEDTDIERDIPLTQRPCGLADAEMAKWPLEIKRKALPPAGAILTAGPIQTKEGWRMVPFKVTYSNASKLRISCELINYLIPVPDPPGRGPLPESEDGRTTLDVHHGELGGTSSL